MEDLPGDTLVRKDIVYYYNRLGRDYRDKAAHRWSTFKIAMNLYTQLGGQTIVETGCVREKDDWGAGSSTVLFGELCKDLDNGSHIWTVDNNAEHIGRCRNITKEWENYITYTVSDSVAFLGAWVGPQIDFLYLDSYDYPYWDVINKMGRTQDDVEVENRQRGQEFEAEIVATWGSIIDSCQNHCLKELNAALPHLHKKSIILIDDNNLAGGGKPRVAKDRLIELGYTCLLDYQQTLWIKW